jgi:hypothetical protein
MKNCFQSFCISEEIECDTNLRNLLVMVCESNFLVNSDQFLYWSKVNAGSLYSKITLFSTWYVILWLERLLICLSSFFVIISSSAFQFCCNAGQVVKCNRVSSSFLYSGHTINSYSKLRIHKLSIVKSKLFMHFIENWNKLLVLKEVHWMTWIWCSFIAPFIHSDYYVNCCNWRCKSNNHYLTN